MKKTIVIVALLTTGFAYSQSKPVSCCVKPATELYAKNAGNESFRSWHAAPLPFHYNSEKGKDISYPTPDGKTAHAWEVKADRPTNYYLFVVHEWWGLNDYIKRESERMGKDLNINVIALDLYDNIVTADKEEAAKTMMGVKTDRAIAIIRGAYAYAGENARVFTIGWCFGGGWSLQTSIIGGSQAAGCIMFYGQPESDIEKLKKLQVDVIGFFGNLDQWPSPQVVDTFAADMKKAGKNLFINRYEATHAFANPSNPNFNKEASADAYQKLLAFVKERMH